MKRAQIVTPWMGTGFPAVVNGVGIPDPRRPAVAEAFPLTSYFDVSNTPGENLTPDPNLLVVEVTCDDATMAAIEADQIWGDAVLWTEGA